MKSLGIIRNFDALGRVVVPKEIRKVLGIDAGTPVEMFQEGEAIIIKKYHSKCEFCDECDLDELQLFNEKYICIHCIHDILKYIR